jgi:hypothetical protein
VGPDVFKHRGTLVIASLALAQQNKLSGKNYRKKVIMRTCYDLKGTTYLEPGTKVEDCDMVDAPHQDIGPDMTTIISPTLS